MGLIGAVVLMVIIPFLLPSCQPKHSYNHTSTSDTSILNPIFRKGEAYSQKPLFNPDSAIRLLGKVLVLAGQDADPALLWKVYDGYALVFSTAENYALALEYYYKQLHLLDSKTLESTDSLSRLEDYAKLYVRIGSCYFNIDNHTKALDYYTKSLKVVEKLGMLNPHYPYNEKKMILINNIGSAYLSSYQFHKAHEYFEQALAMNLQVDKPAFTASICNNLGIVAKERRQFEEAFRYYAKALLIRQQLEDTAGMAQTYNNIGDAQMLTGNYAKAKQTLLQAQSLSKAIGNVKSEMKAANFLTQVFENLGDYSNALRLYKRFKVLHDSIISNEQVQNSAKLELRYLFEKQQKEAELGQQILLAAKERKALIYMVISAFLLSSLVILFLLNRQQRSRIAKALLEQQRLDLESKNLTLEKQNLEMEKQQLQRDLEFRNKELSTHVLYLIEKNEFIASLINKLLDYKTLQDPEMKGLTEDLLMEMQANVDNKLWNEFEMRFQQVHQDFYQKLLAKFPDLSPNEIKICAFLKLNMTTKDISSITFQSIKSIQVARNRLRRKMGIDRDENLIILLQQL